ncbi:hypothetical protein [Paraburkholderia sp. BL6669N2]|uniref:hypothetical protein n=1 Tax=Paraburkholderia sp. BL6669N2 TaxID=1938807 RepID=UPI0011C072F5|nr:hypothetical protein [Paraburkholderia sp. BL6669N2]
MASYLRHHRGGEWLARHGERAIMEGVLWRWHEMLKADLIDAEAALRKREAGSDGLENFGQPG